MPPNRQQCHFVCGRFTLNQVTGFSLTAARSATVHRQKSNFAELLLGMCAVAGFRARFFLVRPALLPRLAQAARGRFARLDSTLR